MHGKSVSNLGHVTDEVPVYYVTVCDISSFELDAVTITSMKYKLFIEFRKLGRTPLYTVSPEMELQNVQLISK